MKTELSSSISLMSTKERFNPKVNIQRIGIPGRAIQHGNHTLALKKETFQCVGAAERNSGGLAWPVGFW